MTKNDIRFLKIMIIVLAVIAAVIIIGYAVNFLTEAIAILLGLGGATAGKKLLDQKKKADEKARNENREKLREIIEKHKEQAKKIERKRGGDLRETEMQDKESLKKSILDETRGYIVIYFLVVIIIAMILFLFSSKAISSPTKPTKVEQICFSVSEARRIKKRIVNLKADLALCRLSLKKKAKICKENTRLLQRLAKNDSIFLQGKLRIVDRNLRILRVFTIGLGIAAIVGIGGALYYSAKAKKQGI